MAAAVPLLLLGLNLLVFGTFTVFIENRGEFLISYSSALLTYYLPALAALMAVGLVPLTLGEPSRRLFTTAVIFLAFITYIHGNLLLWDTGILDGTALDLSKTRRGVIDAALWIALAGAMFRYRGWLLIHGWKICAVLILFQAIGVAAQLYERRGRTTPELAAFPESLAEFSSDTNIIHIILDGFQGDIFEDLLKESPALGEHFSGFTFFRDATTTSPVTYLSVPATLSGKPFRNQVTISEYHAHTLNGDNLYSFLASKGFEVDVATAAWWNKPNTLFSSYYPIPTPYNNQQEVLLSSALLLADISLYRQAPHFLKSLVYRSGAWLLSGMLTPRPEQQFKHYSNTAFVADLQKRMSVSTTKPKYKFIHVISPHAPFVSAPDCSYPGTTLEYTRQSFSQQASCTLNSVTAFLDTLKKLGIYDTSMLIIHGDHGGGVPFDMFRKNGTKTTSSEVLYHAWGAPFPLVLIKPPGATGKIHTSDKQVQLPDIPVTIARQFEFGNAFSGQSMLDGPSVKDINRVYYTSRMHRNDAAAKDYFDDFTAYRVMGSIYQAESWQEAEQIASPLTTGMAEYPWGSELSFGSQGNFRPMQNGGWIISTAKDTTWTKGDTAGLAIHFPVPNGPVIMRARIRPLLAPGKLDRQRVFVFVGGKEVGAWQISGNGFQDVELSIPAALLSAPGKTEITFKLPDAQSPQNLGIGKDKRELALAFYSLQFEPAPASPPTE